PERASPFLISLSVRQDHCFLFFFFFFGLEVFASAVFTDSSAVSAACAAGCPAISISFASDAAISFAFAPNLVFMTYQSAPVMQMEVYVPHAIPTIRGAANSLIELTPRIYSTTTMMNVVRLV